MSEFDLLLRSSRVVTAFGELAGAVCVRGGRIVALLPRGARASADVDEDLGDLALLPGLVDSHVHVNEPGRTEWEGFATATRAAAAGGVTTVIDMPLNSVPPTVDLSALEAKRKAADGQCHVDVGFWGGAVPGSLGQLRALHDAGVFGFKCFTSPSGVDEFAPLSWAQVEAALREVRGFDGLLIVHAEEPSALNEPEGPGYADFLASRPDAAEQTAVRRLGELAAVTGARAHVLHVSAAAAAREVARARDAGARISAETCPHYLTLAAEDVPDGATEHKCCPPIRGRANAEALWSALAAGAIGSVVSDHSPCVPELKQGDFGSAWGGIASLQLGLPLVWTGARSRGHGLTDVARWMATAPAALVGLPHKGRIATGCDADLVAFAPDDEFVVDPATLRHRHPVTPYAGKRLTGVVRRTWLRGRPVDDEPAGQLLRRSRE
ncbi:MAG: allantoinase AllB [Micromonosporaceae bacterium]|nr:allantoinase AllB [Micromonosporaceae bacterium]